MPQMKRDMSQITREIRQMKRDLSQIKGDLPQMKRDLSHIKRAQRFVSCLF